jgi:hypothetical protein
VFSKVKAMEIQGIYLTQIETDRWQEGRGALYGRTLFITSELEGLKKIIKFLSFVEKTVSYLQYLQFLVYIKCKKKKKRKCLSCRAPVTHACNPGFVVTWETEIWKVVVQGQLR